MDAVCSRRRGLEWGGDTLQISYQDSANCGGSNSTVQWGIAERYFCISRPARLTVRMTGRVETERADFDAGYVQVDGNLVCSGASTQVGGGCAMMSASASGSIVLTPGRHRVTLSSETVDGYFHVGAFWKFELLWESL